MKRKYTTPWIEVEDISLTAAVASGCDPVVTLGPDVVNADWDVCEKDFDFGTYSEPLLPWNPLSGLFSLPANTGTSFTKDSGICTCYYTASGEGYFTS